MTIGKLFSVFLSLIMTTRGVITRPRDTVCPGAMWVNGVRSSGEYECRLDDPRALEVDCSGTRDCHDETNPLDVFFTAHVFCRTSEVAVQDGRRIWCRSN